MSDPVRVGEVLPEVIAELLRRHDRRDVSPVAEGDSGRSLWENDGTWREPDRANESGSLTAHRLTRNERG